MYSWLHCLGIHKLPVRLVSPSSNTVCALATKEIYIDDLVRRLMFCIVVKGIEGKNVNFEMSDKIVIGGMICASDMVSWDG